MAEYLYSNVWNVVASRHFDFWWEGVVTLHSPLRTDFTDRLPELPALPSQANAIRVPSVGRKRIV
jgi:hypothetical protein